ncbi:MAG: PH domain-containing protein [Sphaerochaetaceae bacterium]|nr:PH domain-containing protein [Sphaerochaetaceae bacterium]MDX9939401.1 PH domain-containing protein [Sphaerochaetaceae bacterium]
MAGSRQGVKEIRERMQELYVYDLYGFRTELKTLSSILYPYEKINCFATGIFKGKRRMLVVTHYRLIILSTGFGSAPEIFAFDREHISDPRFTKRFFTSSISFDAEGKTIELAMVSRRVLELFVWAVRQPLPKRT